MILNTASEGSPASCAATEVLLVAVRMYPDFVEGVEDWAKNCGKEGEKYLWKDQAENSEEDASIKGKKLQPWEVGFTAAGGFLAPAFAGDSVATWAPPSQSGTARWLDAVQVRELEPQLHRDVVGGWWFPEDASVDARRLTLSLRAACVAAGVQFMVGSDCEATSLELSGKIHYLISALWRGRAIVPIMFAFLFCVFYT